MSFDRVTAEAFAKINLTLDITGRAGGGYHTVETIMHSIGLCDTLTIERRSGRGVRVECDAPGIPEGRGNIAHAAASEFLKFTGLDGAGVLIGIKKRIPAEAGLGGGSADAAAVILGLDAILKTNLSPEQLKEIGVMAGMDVPFCLAGGCALAMGRGEELTPLPMLPDCRVVVAKPAGGVSTKRAYEIYDGCKGHIVRPDTQRMISSLEAGDLAGVGAGMVNAFSSVDETGESEAIGGVMLRAGAAGASLSGSGSAVAGLFADEDAANRCLERLKALGYMCFITRPSATGVALC